MGQVLSIPYNWAKHTAIYYRGLYHFLIGPGRRLPYEKQENATRFLPIQPPQPPQQPQQRRRRSSSSNDSAETILFHQHARVHLFSLACNFYLYNRPHYRKPSYRRDLLDNLRNVAIPGTGMPLSWIATSRFVALPYLLTVYPTISWIAACHYALTTWDDTSLPFGKRLSDEYARRLLAPDDWFSLWRLNCNVVALHSFLNGKDTASDYEMENKWAFLQEGKKRGVPVSPFLDIPALVCKHKNEEGGLGIFFYRNATHGGDWILQERIENSDWVASLLPSGAPLSTFRVITCSKIFSSPPGSSHQPNREQQVKALSCVFRAGRKGAATDHDSILFDVDITTGLIRNGTTNSNWYQLGPQAIFTCPWRSRNNQDYKTHPDDPSIRVAGQQVPNIQGILRLAEQAHCDMCPTVPFAGWDVVLAKNENCPVCLLEVNLSCNFFRGSFDKKYYLDFIEEMFEKLQAQRLELEVASV